MGVSSENKFADLCLVMSAVVVIVLAAILGVVSFNSKESLVAERSRSADIGNQTVAGLDIKDEAGRVYAGSGPTQPNGRVVVKKVQHIGGSPFVRLVVEVPKAALRPGARVEALHALGVARFNYRPGDEVTLDYINMADDVGHSHIRLASEPVWRAPRIPMVAGPVTEPSWLILEVGETPWEGKDPFGPAYELRLASVGSTPVQTATVWVGDPAMTGVLNWKGLENRRALAGTMFPTLSRHKNPYADWHQYYTQHVVLGR
ncbi:MAG: hypothetical protein COV10_03730 [Candidatus Vogelbacteria bacterium CG10_big_fil_rev_8_21_14_0_10_51_16]|uniref:Uncharacterized protein n=1 Tax=Candidatus Vogelbacteria bacterium CG10_big_fil_rev_8_21_14_0_10_51_16 TaxID=1975045 RepID=A0A2H0RDX3_9BACT|nr:MAG: hypothetical protein COV10_03730 [Candidatus Vogelbacteria bacterium CG10_big_fil_rev_8_21_14_0_10_51_16]